MASPASGAGAQALPDEAYAAALASVPGVGPKTLRHLVEDRPPRDAWEALLSGGVGLPASRQSLAALGHARRVDVAAMWAAHLRAGVGVCILGRPGYPSALAADPQAPAVLFYLGAPLVLDVAPRVAIVGTRSATRYGLGVAAQLGADLAAAGVTVVSGLALGSDGAAHEGAVAVWRTSREAAGNATPTAPAGNATATESGVPSPRGPRAPAPPVAVVAGSVASPYPRQHAGLWRRVAEAGAVLSESPIGVADLAWRFPLRNRIIAALADVVVVVECHVRGGSLHTVQAATARGVPVGAVPGSVRSPASAGTNALLADGCFVVRDASDVLVAVGLASAAGAVAPHPVAGPQEPAPDRCGALSSPTREIVDALGWEPATLEDLLERTGLGIDLVCSALERLRARELVRGEAGTWVRA